MKNLKRALAVLVVVTMMISTVAFASFSDVKDGTSVANAVNVGVGLNLFKGYEDGTFKAEGDITRAEFAAIVVRALGQEAQAAGAATSTSFTDVKADHWAAGYINIVTRLGIVNGYGDGTYGPEDKVTYEQAIKMIVVALGYSPAIGSAGYPVGYLTKAGELGITSGVAGSNGVAANRGTVAQLIFNALDVPIMVQTGYGTNLDYVVQDGVNTNTTRKTIMSDYLNVVKLQVMVDSLSTTDGKVKVVLKNVYKTKYSDDFKVGNTPTIFAGKSGIDQMVGQKVIAYLAYDSNADVSDSTVVFAKKDTSVSDQITVKSDDVDSAVLKTADVTVAAVGTPGVAGYTPGYVTYGTTTFNYWANSSDRKTTPVTVKNNADIYVNGEKVTSTVVSKIGKDAFYGEVTLVKNDTNTVADYDTIFVTNYKNIIVDSVNKNTSRVISKNNTSSLSFDATEKTIKATLLDEKGATMAWTDLKEWDVVSIKQSLQANKTITLGQLVKNSVTGKVIEAQDINTSKVQYTIDGKTYKVDTQGIGSTNPLKLADEGTFYFDILGRLAYYDTSSTLSSNYAYVVKVGIGSGLDSNTQIKLLNVKGELVTLNTSTKVKLDEVSNIPTADLLTTGAALPATITYVDPITNTGKLAAGQFITYAVNSNNEITTISRTLAQNTTLQTSSNKVFTEYTRAVTGTAVANVSTYASDSKSLTTNDGSKVYFDDKTIVMVAPKYTSAGAVANAAATYTAADDDYELLNVASLSDEQTFRNVRFFNVDDSKVVSAVLVEAQVSIVSSTEGAVAIAGTSSANNADGDQVNKFNAYQNGAIASLSTVDTNVVGKIGDFAVVAKNVKGEVKTLDIVSRIVVPTSGFSSLSLAPITVGSTTTYNNWSTLESSTKVRYYAGKVTSIKNKTVTLGSSAQGGGITFHGTSSDFVVNSATNVYVYDQRTSSDTNKVSMEDINFIDVRTATDKDAFVDPAASPRVPKLDVYGAAIVSGTTPLYESSGAAIKDVYVVAREYDSKIVDVIMYILK